MSVSRDFIDSCSPEAPAPGHRIDAAPPPLGRPTQASAQCGGTTLVFGFHANVGCPQRVDILAQDWSLLPVTFAERPPMLPPTPPARPRSDLTSVLNFVLRKVYPWPGRNRKGNGNKSMKAVAFPIHSY